MINLEKVERGSIVWYRLLPKDLPIKPNKLWRGQVDYCGPFGIRVSSLDPGYENLQEWIRYEQVIGIEKGMDVFDHTNGAHPHFFRDEPQKRAKLLDE